MRSRHQTSVPFVRKPNSRVDHHPPISHSGHFNNPSPDDPIRAPPQDHGDKEKAYQAAMSSMSSAQIISAVAAKNLSFNYPPHHSTGAGTGPPPGHLPLVGHHHNLHHYPLHHQHHPSHLHHHHHHHNHPNPAVSGAVNSMANLPATFPYSGVSYQRSMCVLLCVCVCLLLLTFALD